jgi:hypothetical protein
VDNSYEAEVHVREYGQTHDSVCWMQIGYASGYTSAFMGRFILFKEVECAATGRNQCRIVGKPVEEWPDAHELTPTTKPTPSSTTCSNCAARWTPCAPPSKAADNPRTSSAHRRAFAAPIR